MRNVRQQQIRSGIEVMLPKLHMLRRKMDYASIFFLVVNIPMVDFVINHTCGLISIIHYIHSPDFLLLNIIMFMILIPRMLREMTIKPSSGLGVDLLREMRQIELE